MTTQHTAELKARRVLIVDDTPDIHAIFRKVFASSSGPESPDERELRALEQTLFEGDAKKAASQRSSGPDLRLEVTSAYQGEEAIELARKADPGFFLAFVDMRMPPAEPPNGMLSTAHFHVIQPASARNSSTRKLGWMRSGPK